MHRAIVGAALYAGTITEALGARLKFGGRAPLKIQETAAKDGLGDRSRVVIPNAQSRISVPLRNHSSVNEKITRPDRPNSKAARDCQFSRSAWFCSPSRIVSMPVSLNSSGRLPVIAIR